MGLIAPLSHRRAILLILLGWTAAGCGGSRDDLRTTAAAKSPQDEAGSRSLRGPLLTRVAPATHAAAAPSVDAPESWASAESTPLDASATLGDDAVELVSGLRRLPPIEYAAAMSPADEVEVSSPGDVSVAETRSDLPVIEVLADPLAALRNDAPGEPMPVAATAAPLAISMPLDSIEPQTDSSGGASESAISITGPDGNVLSQDTHLSPIPIPQHPIDEAAQGNFDIRALPPMQPADEAQKLGEPTRAEPPLAEPTLAEPPVIELPEGAPAESASAEAPILTLPPIDEPAEIAAAEPLPENPVGDRYSPPNANRNEEPPLASPEHPFEDTPADSEVNTATPVRLLPPLEASVEAPGAAEAFLSGPSGEPVSLPEPPASETAPPPAASPSGDESTPATTQDATQPLDGLLLHATQARHHVQQGFGAANRGMLYTARQEFLQALRIVAEAKDARLGRRAHMGSLAAGLTAVEEAEKIRQASTAVANVNLAMLIATHRTPILKEEDLSEMLPLAAIDEYHQFAARQLGDAAAGDPSGSMALYGLARIYEHLGSENGADRVARSRQSVALHEAALLAHPENHLAAHELGIVLARLGRYERAIAMLTRSVELAPTSLAYHNLATVCRQAGRQESATVAAQYATQMAAREQAPGGGDQRVTWLQPGEFARTSEQMRGTPAAASAAHSPSPVAAAASGDTSSGSSRNEPTLGDRLAAPLKAVTPHSWWDSTRK